MRSIPEEHQRRQQHNRQQQNRQGAPPSPDALEVTAPAAPASSGELGGLRPGQPSPAMVVSLQRLVGNQATLGLLGRTGTGPGRGEPGAALLRDPDRPQLPPTATSTVKTWKMPFNLGEASINEEAAIGMEQIIDKFHDLKALTDFADIQAACDSVIGSLTPEVQQLRAAGAENPLSEKDMRDVTVMGSLASGAYSERMDEIAQKLLTDLEPIEARPTDGEEDQLAEELHNRFRTGDVQGIESVKQGIDRLRSFTKSTIKVVEWANRVRAVVKMVGPGTGDFGAPEEVSKLLQGKSALQEGLGYANQMLLAAKLIGDIDEIGHDRAGSIDAAADEMGAAMDAVNLGLTFVKGVPLLGDLWSKYYMPLTEACLKGIKVLARYADEENRQLAFVDWQLAPSKGDVPKIPKENLGNFLGGQPVFDYMYRLVNDIGPQMSDEVEDFFVANHEAFLQAVARRTRSRPRAGAIGTTRSRGGDRETSPNLAQWLPAHREPVVVELSRHATSAPLVGGRATGTCAPRPVARARFGQRRRSTSKGALDELLGETIDLRRRSRARGGDCSCGSRARRPGPRDDAGSDGRRELRELRPRRLAEHSGRRRCGQHLLQARAHEPVRPHVHAARISRRLCRRSLRSPARERGRAQHLTGAHDQPCERGHGERGAAGHRGRQLPELRLPHGERGRPARLSAGPDRVEADPVPVRCLLARRARDPARQRSDLRP